MPKPIIRETTKDDVKELYGKLDRTFYDGLTVELDGKVVAITGIYRSKEGVPFLFARIRDELRPYKLTIWRTSVKMIEKLKQFPSPVYAVADPEIPKSDDLLMKMGFNYHSYVPGIGELYEWI